MKLNILTISILLAGSCLAGGPATARTFGKVSLSPEAQSALKAKNRKIPNPFPNSANRGRKFNPTGDLVGTLKTAGTQKMLVLFVNFTTPPPGGPAARLSMTLFDDLLFGQTYDPPEYAKYPNHPTDRTLKNFYKEVSYGQVDVITLNMPSSIGWAQTGKPYSYYCEANGVKDYGFGSYPNNAQGLVVDAVKAVDAVVDFSKYAVDGVIPNLLVVVAGSGAEWSTDPRLIWSHSWGLSEGTPLTNGYVADGVRIDNYAMMPEVGGDTTGYLGVIEPAYPPTVGVFAHEYAHVLGLPDEYDYGGESQGTGAFSLMAGGSWNQYPSDLIFSGNSPSHLDAWSKYRLGLVTPKVIDSPATIVLPAVQQEPVIYKIVVPNSGGREYFLLENRQMIGFDQGLIRRNAHGLAVYHIDDNVLTRNYWRPNEAENWKEFRSEGWRKASNGESHYGISLIQADGLWQLEKGTSGGNAGDLYPGSTFATALSSTTSPNTTSYYFWKGSTPPFGFSKVRITNIKEVNGKITAEVDFEP